MNFATTTILAAALLVAGTTTASSPRRNRLYDVTGEFGRFDESDPAFESLFRELAQDDSRMGFQNSMSMSMDVTSAPTTSTPRPSTSATPPTGAPSVPSAPTVRTSPTPAPTPTVSGSPTKKTATGTPTTGSSSGCSLDSSAFENDASTEVLLKIDVETVSISTGFLPGLMDAMLAGLQNEFGLCLAGNNSRTLIITSRSRRRMEDDGGGTTESITGVTLRNTELLPSNQLCKASSDDDNTCHVVFTSVVVYGTSRMVATEGASSVVAMLQEQDFSGGDIVDVRIVERGDHHDEGDSISNGVSDSDNNELGVETTVSSSSSSTGSSTGLAVALSLVAAGLIAIATVVALSRSSRSSEDDMDASNRLEMEEEKATGNVSVISMRRTSAIMV